MGQRSIVDDAPLPRIPTRQRTAIAVETAGAQTAAVGEHTHIAAERFISIWLAGGHGLLGAATLLLVLLERSGGGS